MKPVVSAISMALLIAVATLATSAAQSPNAFGVPSADQPQPATAIKAVPASGVNAATVPGAISGYDALLKRFGTVGFKEAFERAARLAEEGWGLAERRHSDLKNATTGLRTDPDSKETFLVDGQTPALYS